MANLDLKYYWAVFKRRLPYFLVIVTLLSAIGITIASILPPVYQSSASLLAEPQQIPGSLAESTAEINPFEQIQIVEQRIMTRANLYELGQRIGLYADQPDLSVGTLAHRHTCTPRFIQRLFESEGTTFTEYVLDRRLARAHRMLTDPRRAGDKISAIALDAGFGDLSYFNRAFRRRYGETPSGVRGQAVASSG